MTTTRNGVASKEVERALGVTYKTAHKMTTQVRKLMKQHTYQKKLSGNVEADETYVSIGKAKGVDVGRGARNKKPVFAIVERMGEVRAQTLTNVRSDKIHPYIEANVEKTAQLSTDEFPLYTNLFKLGFADHTVIKHAIKKYRNGVTSTNTIEGFFSQLKRMIHGTHIHVSEQHLEKYVDEAVFRYNHRFKDVDMFGCLMLKIMDYQA